MLGRSDPGCALPQRSLNPSFYADSHRSSLFPPPLQKTLFSSQLQERRSRHCNNKKPTQSAGEQLLSPLRQLHKKDVFFGRSFSRLAPTEQSPLCRSHLLAVHLPVARQPTTATRHALCRVGDGVDSHQTSDSDNSRNSKACLSARPDLLPARAPCYPPRPSLLALRSCLVVRAVSNHSYDLSRNVFLPSTFSQWRPCFPYPVRGSFPWEPAAISLHPCLARHLPASQAAIRPFPPCSAGILRRAITHTISSPIEPCPASAARYSASFEP